MSHLVRLRELREEAAELLALIDTAQLPPPDRISDSPHLPGPEWIVREDRDQWRVHATAQEADVVFIHTPDAMFITDVLAVRVRDARRIAMSLLAACDWVDKTRLAPDGGNVIAFKRSAEVTG